MRKALRRAQPGGNAQTHIIGTPVKGWRSDQGIYMEQPGAALKLLNWVPEPDAVRVRRGTREFSTGMTSAVESLLEYSAGIHQKLFASAGTVIWEVTGGGAAVSSLTGLSEPHLSHTMFSTSGGQFLVVANGSDTVKNYNGTAWSVPAITGVSSADLFLVWVHKHRLWFLEKNSLSAWYLPVDSIGGAAIEFDIGGLFENGGRFVGGATWSVDAGDGMDDLIVFVTSEGEAAIYSMSDPSDPSTLMLKGVYFIGRPVGGRCLFQLGGDLLAITYSGVIPFSKVITIGDGFLDAAALTAPIRRQYGETVRQYGEVFGWELVIHPRSNLLILNVPTIEHTEAIQFVMNLLTKAWAQWDAINAITWHTEDQRLFFGAPSGRVLEADVGSEDDGNPITAEMVPTFTRLGRGRQAMVKLIRPNIEANVTSRGTVVPIFDYTDIPTADTAPEVVGVEVAEWDVAVWDVDIWPNRDTIIAKWRGDGGIGTTMSLHYTVTPLSDTPDEDLNFRILSFDVVYEAGGIL